MPTECSAERFDFGVVEGRAVDAAFDAGLVTSDAGALLLGATDRAIGMVDRFAACFRDYRRQDLVETCGAHSDRPAGVRDCAWL
jgi:Transposase DDE domain group 1